MSAQNKHKHPLLHHPIQLHLTPLIIAGFVVVFMLVFVSGYVGFLYGLNANQVQNYNWGAKNETTVKQDPVVEEVEEQLQQIDVFLMETEEFVEEEEVNINNQLNSINSNDEVLVFTNEQGETTVLGVSEEQPNEFKQQAPALTAQESVDEFEYFGVEEQTEVVNYVQNEEPAVAVVNTANAVQVNKVATEPASYFSASTTALVTTIGLPVLAMGFAVYGVNFIHEQNDKHKKATKGAKKQTKTKKRSSKK